MNMTQEDKTEVHHFIRQTGLSLFSSFTELWSSFLIRSMRLGQSQKTECQTWHATLHGCMSVALLCQFPLLNWLKHLKLSHNRRNERQDKTVRVRQHRRSMAPSLSAFYRLSQVSLEFCLYCSRSCLFCNSSNSNVSQYKSVRYDIHTADRYSIAPNLSVYNLLSQASLTFWATPAILASSWQQWQLQTQTLPTLSSCNWSKFI